MLAFITVFASHELRAISSFEIAKTQTNFLRFSNLRGINFSLTEKSFCYLASLFSNIAFVMEINT